MENTDKLIQNHFKNLKQSCILEQSFPPSNEVRIYSHNYQYSVFAFGKLVKGDFDNYKDAYDLAYDVSDYCWKMYDADITIWDLVDEICKKYQ